MTAKISNPVSWTLFQWFHNKSSSGGKIDKENTETQIGLASFTAERVEAFRFMVWSRSGQNAWILNKCESRSLYLFCVGEMYEFAIRTACGTMLKCNQFSVCRESQNNFLTATLEKDTPFSPGCLYLQHVILSLVKCDEN